MEQPTEEMEGMLTFCDYNGLNDRYLSACERHGTVPHGAISAAFDKVRSQHAKKEKQTLELLLDQIPETDMEPLIEMLSAVESSDLDAVDVVFSSTVSNLRWPLLVQILRSAGSKLRMADLRDNVLGREAVRELFQGGFNCQSLDLSFSRIRKLEMLGYFPNLHTLKLDYCFPVTCLPLGCFSAMPKLTKLSMCGTKVMNLWTTSAALRKLSALRELRFQKCLCCQGTGQCAALAACLQNDGVSWREGRLYQGGAERTQPRQWAPPPARGGEEYESHGSAPSDFSGSEDDSEHLFTDAESEDSHLSGNSSGESVEDSDVEQAVPSESQDMDVVREGNPNYHNLIREISEDRGDPYSGNTIADEDLRSVSEQLVTFLSEDDGGNFDRHSILDLINLDDSSILPESVTSIEGILSNASVRRREDLETDDSDITMLEALERVVATRTNNSSREAAAFIQESNRRSTFRLSDGGGEGASERGAESSGEDGEEPCPITTPASNLAWALHGARHASPICCEKGYREFMITMLPALQVLDNVAVTDSERERARCVFEERFEPLANGRRVKENILKIIKLRETGGFGIRAPCDSRLGYIDDKRSPAEYIRSLSAAKMGTSAWPATESICRSKKPNLYGGRRCRPRQFEYHPTEPSYMVFGTVQGEVVVINHESDKVVGYVQSIGAPHSILGLCWLNKDPNKLIAGSENGCLQLYDVNHMRASMISANRRNASSSASSRYQSQGNGGSGRQSLSGSFGSRSMRSPTIYTYDAFEQFTSVHINSTDDYFVASGYSNHVGLYDLRTGTQLQIFRDLHKEHINVVKFANHSPQIFATSSFDKEIKMWDLRQKVTQPLYTVRSNRGNVMVCFSRDDHYLLSSAVDNEVRQHLAVDGRLHMKFDITPKGSNQNYTRSYYLNGRDYIISGSCEENVVRVCCAQTGRRLRDLAVEGRGLRNSSYVQSLRGDPFKDFHFCMLVAYNHPHSRSEIVKVNLLGGEFRGEDHESQSQ
ncbi:protein DWD HYPERSENSITIVE TO UV-B 1 isoform X2 [Physcomitrium patens]